MSNQTFKCKEKGCDLDVTYERITVLGFMLPNRRPPKGSRPKKKVYLTCAEGHEHPYEVTG